MTIAATIVTPLLDAAPGELVEVLVELVNDADRVATVIATPVGLGDAAGEARQARRVDVPATGRVRVAIPIQVPQTLGIGQHAIGIRFEEPDSQRPRLERVTLSIASVQRVALRSTPSTVRGRRSGRFDLDITNDEAHPVVLELGADGDAEVDVRFRRADWSLSPGQRAMTSGRMRGRARLFGDDVQHNVQITARSKASRTSVLVPFVQRPLIARRVRSLVAALVVVGLWASLAGGAILWWRERGPDAPATRTAAGVDGTLEPLDDTGGSDGADELADPVTTAPPNGGDTTDSGDGGAGAGADGAGGDGGAGAGADGGAGGDADGNGGDGGAGGDAAGGDAAGGDAGAATDPPSGDAGPGAAPAGGTAGATTSVVRGTLDLDGDPSGVTITPSPMSLQDVASAEAAAFALADRPLVRKIWSARAGFGGSTIQVAQSEAIPAGPFAPDADGIWGVELPVNQTYELAFRRDGFEPRSFVVNPQVGEQIELAVSLEPATGALGGRVTGAGGPLENVRVLVTDGSFDYETVTDGQGNWGLTGVASSEGYTVLATLDGFGADARLITLGPGEQRDDVDLTLRSGETVLIGSVVDSLTGEGLGGVEITVVNGTDSRTSTTLTEGDVGSFSIPQLAAGARVSVTAVLDGYRTATTSVTLGSGATTIEPFRLVPLAATLGGTVVDSESGSPIAGASIQVTRDDLAAPVASVQSVNEGQPGSFTLGRIPPGRYLLTVEHWQHATVRHDLVVESAAAATLDPNDPDRAQPGPSFELVMDPVDTGRIGDRPTGNLSLRVRDADENRPCPLTRAGIPRPEEQCSAIFDVDVQVITTDPAFIEQAEAGTGPFVPRSITTRDPATGAIVEQDVYVFACSPDPDCNSGEDFPDYTIRGIPVGSYTVRLTQDDYNPRTIPITIRPEATQTETVNMARLGEVVGTVIDASQLPDEVSILGTSFVTVLIVNANNPAVVYQTRVIGGTFQTDDEDRLPPGSYRVEVDAFGLGYYVDPDQDVDGDIDTGGLRFDIALPDPDNPAPSRIELQPILAQPYPEIEARVFAPSSIAAAGVDPPVSFGPIGTSPSATLQCASEISTPVTATVADQTVRFTKATVATLDADRDGRLSACTLAVSADDHESLQYVFGGANAAGDAVAELELAEDRFLDVALIRSSTVARQPRGTLEWIDAGRPDPADQQAVPVVGATVTASDVITALVPSDGSAAPDAGAPALVAPYAPALDPVTSALDPSQRAVWDFGAGVRQLVGEARFDITADGFPGGSLFVAIDETGALTTRVETSPDVADDPDVADGSYDIVLEPSQGTIRGRAVVYTIDPNDDVTSVGVSTSINGTGTRTPSVDGSGAYSAADVDAGTWTTTVSAPARHAVIDASPEDLADCLPPGVVSPSQLSVGPGAATFRQCVPPGGESSEALVELVELGSLSIEFVDTAATPNSIDAAAAGISYTIDGSTSTVATAATIDVADLAVPLTPDAYGPGLPLPTQNHTFSLPDAGIYDPAGATVTVFRVSRSGEPADRVQVVPPQPVDLTSAFSLAFQAGAKFEVVVALPEFGKVTGALAAVDSDGAPVPICPDDPATDVPATIVAVPVVAGTFLETDPIGGIIVRSVWNPDPTRDPITTTTCGEFTVQGVAGTYAVTATHPAFASTYPAFVPTYPSNLQGSVPIIDVPGYDQETAVGTLNDPVLRLLPTRIEIDAVDQLGGDAVAGAYFVISRNGTDLVGPALVDDPASPDAWEAQLDPGSGYRLEVRSCAAPPATMGEFDACVQRFPAALGFAVSRSSEVAGTTVIEVPLLAVGGSIEVTLVFENDRQRPVCPRDTTVTVDRLYTSAVDATVDGDDVTTETNAADRSESASTTFGADPQADCVVEDGERLLTFDRLVPTGRHRFTLPAVSGFGPPTVVNGTVPAASGDDFVTDVDVTTLDPTAVTVTYVATPVTIEVRICGERDGAARCNERFPDLDASLTEPGDGGDTIPATTVGAREAGVGYRVTFENVSPDATPYRLGITDTLHDNALTRDVLVQPGTNTYTDPFTFSGRAVRIAVRPLIRNSETGSPTGSNGTERIQLFGGTGPGTWILVSEAPESCSIENDAGQVIAYQCFEDDEFSDYRVVVTRDTYVPVDVEYLGLSAGETVIDDVVLVKRAVLQVNAVLVDGTTNPPFPAALNELVLLARTSDGSTTDGIDRIDPGAVCQPAAGCFQFYADPGVEYRFETGPNAAYVPDETGAITATIGMTPATMPGGVPTLSFVQRAVLQVTATAFDADGVELTSFPASLAALVQIETTDGSGATTAIETPAGCAAADGCFRYYADPGSTYRFRTGSTTAYLPDTSAEIVATAGMTPASGGSATLELRPRIIEVDVTDNGLTVTAVVLTIDGATFTDTTSPYRFSSLSSPAIPLTGDGTVLVQVADGRNRSVSTTALGSAVEVFGYQTVNGTVDSNVSIGATVRASCVSPCSAAARTTTVDTDREFSFSGSSGLDVNPNGSNLAWTIEVMDGASPLAGASSATVTVDATTATNAATPALEGPEPDPETP